MSAFSGIINKKNAENVKKHAEFNWVCYTTEINQTAKKEFGHLRVTNWSSRDDQYTAVQFADELKVVVHLSCQQGSCGA